MSNLAPIAVFLYNRPEHSRQMLDALALNSEAKSSDLFIFCDGPKENASHEQLERIRQVRMLAHQEKRFRDVKVIEQTQNKGLAGSIIAGVTEIVNLYGSIIVVEDDIVVAKDFLFFMNKALQVYEEEPQVMCISGYTYPVKGNVPETFFIKVAECWGWATWKRGWKLLETDGSKLLKEINEKNLNSAFDFEDSYKFTEMLKDQVEGKNNSWAILWYASAFLKNKYCLFPGVSLVQNIGNDGSGTHSLASNDWIVKLSERKINVRKEEVKEDRKARKLISSYFRVLSRSRPSLGRRVLGKFRRFFGK